MNGITQLPPEAVMFIGGETAKIYQHVAGLTLLDSSDCPGFGFKAFRRHVEQRVAHIPHFHWKLHEVPLGLDLPYWVEDDNFSYDHHIRRIAVPSPGDREALAGIVSLLYSKHLDRHRPLWEIWFIEGLEDGQYAVLQKLHHCMMDGQGASKLAEMLCDPEPHGASREIDTAVARARPGAAPEPWQQSLNAALRLAALPLKINREIYGAVLAAVKQRMSGTEKRPPKPPVAAAHFNADIGSYRGLVFGALPLADIRRVKEHFHATVNDVVLAVVGGALREYLLQRGELPVESLRAFMAVSLRTESDDEFSNKVTTTTVTLATACADPAQRLQAIAGESVAVKQKAHSGSKGMMEIVQILPPVLVNIMTSITPPDRIARIMGANLIVSNIRGSAQPLYIAGARVLGIYPMSIIAPGGGLNITCMSYAGDIDFGITIDPDMFPDPWRIIDGLRKSLGEYLALTKKTARRRKKAAPKSRANKRK